AQRAAWPLEHSFGRSSPISGNELLGPWNRTACQVQNRRQPSGLVRTPNQSPSFRGHTNAPPSASPCVYPDRVGDRCYHPGDPDWAVTPRRAESAGDSTQDQDGQSSAVWVRTADGPAQPQTSPSNWPATRPTATCPCQDFQ